MEREGDRMANENYGNQGLNRRQFLRNMGLGGVSLLGGSALLAACAPASSTTSGGAPTTTGAVGTTSSTAAPTTSAAAGRLIKIGYVSPKTGPFAGFGEADDFTISQVNGIFADGLSVAGKVHPVQIITKDSTGNPVTAGEVASELILDDAIDLMVVESTPETTNPVADQCELNGIPCVSAITPWQPWFIGRGGDPASGVGFKWTYHYFWGLEGLIPQFIALWDKLETNKRVGGLFPNDGDGQAWSANFPEPLAGAGYELIDPGLYEQLATDYSAQIQAFEDCDIITGVPLPPEFATFWTQAAQQGLSPIAATIGKALLFPTDVEALDGDSGDGLSSEVWWSPYHPFKSSLTGETSAQIAEAYTSATSRQWTQVVGFCHSLFEVAADVFQRTEDVDDRESVLAAVVATDLDTLVGQVTWSAGAGPKNPVPNVCTTPLVGGQWKLGGDFKYDMTIVDNSQFPDIPTSGEFTPIGG
jgi:branched-chain amino acid transport system substrate-binding protein